METYNESNNKIITPKKFNEQIKVDDNKDALISNEDISDFNFLLKQNFNKPFSEFIEVVVNFLSIKVQAFTSIYYSHNIDESSYKFEAGFGIHNHTNQTSYTLGEGLVGQSIQSGRIIKLLDLPPKSVLINVSNFQLSINSIYIFPVVFNDKVYGAINFNFLHKPSPEQLFFLEQAIQDFAVMVENAQHYKYIKELLNKSEVQKYKLELSEQKLSEKLNELSIAKEHLDEQVKMTDESYSLLKNHYAQLVQNISYAYKIKKTFLPQEKNLKDIFSDYFILYLPKDTVSGDFYWHHSFSDVQIVAVGDCTGHGVSGAFMSLFAINLLNQIICYKNIREPKVILENLRKEVYFFLQQEGAGLKDGFDISICHIEKESPETLCITYAGSKSSIFYTQENVIKKMKSDRIAIGGVHSIDTSFFTSEKIYLNKGEKIYLYTDGVTDICNEKRKSYGTKAFKRFLVNHAHLPMEAQKQSLEKEINTYQGTQSQRDDITVMGIKLN